MVVVDAGMADGPPIMDGETVLDIVDGGGTGRDRDGRRRQSWHCGRLRRRYGRAREICHERRGRLYG